MQPRRGSKGSRKRPALAGAPGHTATNDNDDTGATMIPKSGKAAAQPIAKVGAAVPPAKTDAGKPPDGAMDGMQGEGNYAAARAFNAAESGFVAAGKVAPAAKAAAPRTAAENEAMLAAERKGGARAKA
jgi:hypothetical protein